MSAGDSAQDAAREHEREGRRLLALAGRYGNGAAGERTVAAALQPLTALGWTLLEDRRWSSTSEANIDLIAIGPGGVVVVDAKNWQVRPRLVKGVLTHGDIACGGDVERLGAATRRVAEAVALLGISPVAVTAMMAFAGQYLDLEAGSIRLVGARNAATKIVGLPIRLNSAGVREVAAHIEEEFPQHPGTPPSRDCGPISAAAEPLTLFDVHNLLEAYARSARLGPIEEWMTYLAPDQHDLVRRNWGGPGRISGAGGTGKTVVGLHRAGYLAQQGHGRILFVTFVKNLATVQCNLLRRLAPNASRRVDFRTVHAVAVRLLARHGPPTRVDPMAIRACYDDAWAAVGRPALRHLDPRPGYWRDEIEYVIKGRGFTTLEEYLAADRYGRRTPLRGEHRNAVWHYYTEYENLRRSRGLIDFADVLLLALRSVQSAPLTDPYAAVIIDEVQDLSLTGLRLLHALVGDRPNGLLLIGDARQAVYPGGYRLADAGLHIRGGRSVVLKVNYRNSRSVLAAAERLLGGETHDDIDGTAVADGDPVEVTRGEGHVIEVAVSSSAELDAALLAAVTASPDPAATAVLCADNRAVEHYETLLRRAGLAVTNLDRYDGIPSTAIKVGTFARGKGLEFKQVFLPGYDRTLRDARTGGLADPDRIRHATNELYVAMIRARDTLWLGRDITIKAARSDAGMTTGPRS